MSFIYLKWDKVSNINNSTAQEYLSNHPEVKESDEICLVSENGSVVYVLNTTHMRADLGLADTVSAETVAEAHMAKLAEQNSNTSTAANELENMKQRTADIEFLMMQGGLI